MDVFDFYKTSEEKITKFFMCRVRESLDDIIQSLGSKKVGPAAVGLSATSTSSYQGEKLSEEKNIDVTGMQTEDILKYIEHSKEEEDDLDLF